MVVKLVPKPATPDPFRLLLNKLRLVASQSPDLGEALRKGFDQAIDRAVQEYGLNR